MSEVIQTIGAAQLHEQGVEMLEDVLRGLQVGDRVSEVSLRLDANGTYHWDVVILVEDDA